MKVVALPTVATAGDWLLLESNVPGIVSVELGARGGIERGGKAGEELEADLEV